MVSRDAGNQLQLLLVLVLLLCRTPRRRGKERAGRGVATSTVHPSLRRGVSCSRQRARPRSSHVDAADEIG